MPLDPRPTLTLLGALALAGCAPHLTEQECRAGDWYRRGLADGAQGVVAAATFRSHTEDCAEHGVRPDPRAWQAGYEGGLATFCVPARGYDLGRHGVDDADVCRGRPGYGPFLDGYVRGSEDRLASLRMELDGIRFALESGNGSVELQSRAAGLLAERERTRLLNNGALQRLAALAGPPVQAR